MSAAPGHLLLRAALRDGVVEAVEIVSPRADPSPLFIGLAPAEAATLSGRLFSLCPMAQSLAAQAAGDAASKKTAGATERRARALKLLCERLGEMLRASLLDWPAEAAPTQAELTALREALKILRTLPQAERDAQAFARLRQTTDVLGLGDGSGFFARQMAEARGDFENAELATGTPDALGAEDDAAVWEAMAADAGFARTPALAGRCAETGAAARQNCGEGGLLRRLAARRADMAATLDAVQGLLDGAATPAGLVAKQGDGAGGGFAAVDSARGRLYHALRLDNAGRIADYRIVAPTEWNFHPDGPFSRMLRGARIDAGAAAKRRIERLAFVFDPCIRAVAEISDQSHA
jgi:coenzyme F420-reducing hydrogenase alpha subunit